MARSNDLDILGEKEIRRAFKTLPAALAKKAVRRALRKGMKVVKAKVKEYVPRDTGQLEGAIKVKAAKRSRLAFGVNVEIGEDDFVGESFYGAAVDLGTKYVEARNFMRDGFEAGGEAAKSVAVYDLGRSILVEVEKARGK